MPYHYGPWIQPPDQWFTVTTVFGETWTDGNQDSSNWPHPTAAAQQLSTGVGHYSEALLQAQFTSGDITYHPPLPAGAIDVQYDSNQTPHQLQVTVAVAGSTSGVGTDMTSTGFRAYTRPVTYSPTYGLVGPLWTAGSTLATLTPFASFTLSTTSISVSDSASALGQEPVGTSGYQYGYGILIATDRQVMNTPLATPSSGTDIAQSAVTSVTTQIYATPARYRFLYSALPSLRQYPRDDFLGGAPRQGHNSTSVQASARQGWTNNYR